MSHAQYLAQLRESCTSIARDLKMVAFQVEANLQAGDDRAASREIKSAKAKLTNLRRCVKFMVKAKTLPIVDPMPPAQAEAELQAIEHDAQGYVPGGLKPTNPPKSR